MGSFRSLFVVELPTAKVPYPNLGGIAFGSAPLLTNPYSQLSRPRLLTTHHIRGGQAIPETKNSRCSQYGNNGSWRPALGVSVRTADQRIHYRFKIHSSKTRRPWIRKQRVDFYLRAVFYISNAKTLRTWTWKNKFEVSIIDFQRWV